MSGRTLYQQPDGRRTTYRKTMARRRAPIPWYRQPEWQICITLPNTLEFFGLTPGHAANIRGVRVKPPYDLLISGRNKDWCIEQIARFITLVAPDWRGRLAFIIGHEGTTLVAKKSEDWFIERNANGWFTDRPAHGRSRPRQGRKIRMAG